MSQVHQELEQRGFLTPRLRTIFGGPAGAGHCTDPRDASAPGQDHDALSEPLPSG